MKNAEQMIQEFQVALEELQPLKETPLKLALAGIEICNTMLSRLQQWVEDHDFENLPSEIYFFKMLKVVPMSYLIFYTEVRTCELRKPKAGIQYQLSFLEKELKKINKFFYRNSDFVHYMELGHTYLDHQYFSRSTIADYPISPLSSYYQFPEFSTSYDMLWAKVKAMNMLIHYIREQLEHLQPGTHFTWQRKKHTVLVWTGSKSALVELIYALYSDQVINHGALDLKSMSSAFEDFFNIKLDQLYKSYSELKERKGSRTKFLEELISKLEQKMHAEDR